MVNLDIDISVKCRACLSEEHEMHRLYGEFDQGLSLADILKSTTSFEIDENDGLSTYLCEICTSIVVDFFNFRSNYQENENYIKSLLPYVKAEIKKECTIAEEQKIVPEHCSDEVTFEDNINTEKQLTQTNNNSNEEDANKDTVQQDLEENEELEKITGEYVEPQEVLNNISNDDVFSCKNGKDLDSIKYTCEECAVSFLFRSGFQQHMLAEHDITILSIDNENSKVPNDSNFNIHSNGKLSCKWCKRSHHKIFFDTYVELAEHHKLHQKFICELCGAGFRKKSYLDDHKEVHDTEKKHICPICFKAFRRRTVLVKHKRIHTHPRHAVCELCGKRFNDKGTLKTHIKLKHTKVRDFFCIICGLSFPLKSTLEKHVYRHQGGRKSMFQCTICNMSYKDKSSLNRHVEVKHSENIRKPSCPECGKQYTTKTNLLKHVRRHHGIKDDSYFKIELSD